MSAIPYREMPTKSAFLVRNRAGLCAFVHGVSVGFLVGQIIRAAGRDKPRLAPTDRDPTLFRHFELFVSDLAYPSFGELAVFIA